MTKNVFEILYTRIESEYGVEATKNDFQVFCEGSEFTNVKDVIDLIETLPFLYQKECVELDQIEVTFDTSHLGVFYITLYSFGDIIAEYKVREEGQKLIIAANDKYYNEDVEDLYYLPLKKHAENYNKMK